MTRTHRSHKHGSRRPVQLLLTSYSGHILQTWIGIRTTSTDLLGDRLQNTLYRFCVKDRHDNDWVINKTAVKTTNLTYFSVCKTNRNKCTTPTTYKIHKHLTRTESQRPQRLRSRLCPVRTGRSSRAPACQSNGSASFWNVLKFLTSAGHACLRATAAAAEQQRQRYAHLRLSGELRLKDSRKW